MTIEYDNDHLLLIAAEKKIDRVASEFEREKAYLFRQDGTAKYMPTEFQERLQTLLEPVRQATVEAKQAAEEVRARCDEEAKLANGDPLLRLTDPVEQQEVSYKQGLIESDAAKLPLPALAERLEAMALHGTKVERLLYARFARRRVEEEQSKVQNQPKPNVMALGERVSSIGGYKAPEGLGQVSRALQVLEAATVDKKLQERLKRADERRNAATSLTMRATKRQRELDGSDAQARRQFAARF